MEYSGIERNRSFADRILKKYQRRMKHEYGISLVYRKKEQPDGKAAAYNRLYQLLTKAFNNRISQYEQKYYHTITNQDNRRFIQTIEQIHNQPGEKKQLIHLFGRLGVVTRNQKEWRETRQTVRQYEEELIMLKRKIKQREEMVLQMKRKEIPEVSIKHLTQIVMENIRREIRMERMRYGPD